MELYPTLYPVTVLALFGAVFGSFLNVLILRLPRGESVVFPGSHCPRCGAPIRWYDNLPVLSYLLLRGRCRGCAERISIQYPLVEAGMALLAVALWLKFGPEFELVRWFAFLLLLTGVALTDARHYLIPDAFSVGGLLLGLALAFLPGGITPAGALIGLAAGGLGLYLVAWLGSLAFRREAMGGGDIKLLAMIGAFTGWPGVLFTVFAGSVLGSLVFGWIVYGMKRRVLVPFGVFLALGAALYVFCGPELTGWYLGLFRP